LLLAPLIVHRRLQITTEQTITRWPRHALSSTAGRFAGHGNELFITNQRNKALHVNLQVRVSGLSGVIVPTPLSLLSLSENVCLSHETFLELCQGDIYFHPECLWS